MTRRNLLGSAAGLAAASAASAAPAARNGRIKQSLTFWCLNSTEWKWDMDRICSTARALGCQSVELVPPDLWPVLKKHGLRSAISGNGMPDPPFQKGVNNPRYRDEVITHTRHAIDIAADAGIPNVIAFTGYKWRNVADPQGGELTLTEGAEHSVKVLTELARHAASRHVTLCLEQLNTRDSSHPMKGHPGYQGDNIDYCADIIRRVNSPNAKLLFDIYHVEIMNGDVMRRLRQYHDIIGHVHTAGNPGRGELDDNQEIHYAGIMRELVKLGYQGYVGQEFIPTRDPMQGLTQAVSLCDVA